jgi:hypothetical protein
MNDQTMAPDAKGELIEQKLDRAAAGAVVISERAGGVQFTNMLEIMEFSKLMSLSREAIPKHLRNNPGMCLAVCIQASEWRMSPFAVANKCYVVNDRIGWEAQLVHAVIEQRAPLVGRVRHSFEGEGSKLVCIVTAHVRGEVHPLVHRSPPIENIKPKNSPLWATKPEVQLYYNTVRDFARIYFPDVLLGVYSKDELEDSNIGADRAKDVTQGLHERLAAAAGEVETAANGFHDRVVEDGLRQEQDPDHAEAATEAEARSVREAASEQEPEPAVVDTRPGKKRTGKVPKDAQAPSAGTETAKKPPDPPREPRNPAEYAAWVDNWLANEATDPDEIETRWGKERKMRNIANVTEEDRLPIMAKVNARKKELRS